MEYVIAATGPRGAGKSMFLAFLGQMTMLGDFQVYANFNIETDFRGKHYKVAPLDTLALFSFDKSLENSLLLIDELQYFVDSRRSSSTGNRLLNFLGIQIRKRAMSIAYSVQDLMWVDVRWRFQTDIWVVCRDAYHTPWGKERHLERGEVVFLQFRDLSGVVTGTSFYQNQRPFANIALQGKKLWGTFDSMSIVGLGEIFRDFSVEKEHFTVGYGSDAEVQPPIGEIDLSEHPVRQRVDVDSCVAQVVNALRNAGHAEIRAGEIQVILQENNIVIPAPQVGKALKRLGVGMQKRDAVGPIYGLK